MNKSERKRGDRLASCNSTKADRAETNLNDVNAVLMIIKLSLPFLSFLRAAAPTTLQTRFSPPLPSLQSSDCTKSLGTKNWQIFHNYFSATLLQQHWFYINLSNSVTQRRTSQKCALLSSSSGRRNCPADGFTLYSEMTTMILGRSTIQVQMLYKGAKAKGASICNVCKIFNFLYPPSPIWQLVCILNSLPNFACSLATPSPPRVRTDIIYVETV